jgi:putative membrane protein
VRPATARAVSRWLPWAAAAAAVAAQIPYPLLPAGGAGRVWLTAGQILAFLAASASHAAHRRGLAFTVRYLVLAVGLGLAVEVLGLHTSWPFGHYAYAGRLGPEVAGVPVLIPLGWAMMAYPALLCGRHAAVSAGRHSAGSAGGPARLMAALAGGVLLAGWDLFLDPRMVAEGFWAWAPGGGPRLNAIPLTNTAGWLLVGTMLVALLDRLPDPTRRPPASDTGIPSRHRPAGWGWTAGDRVPMILLGWTYASWVLACLVFFGQPAVALAGGVGMALPTLIRALRAARRHLVSSVGAFPGGVSQPPDARPTHPAPGCRRADTAAGEPAGTR